MRNRIFILLSVVFSVLQGPLLPPVFLEGLLLVTLINTNGDKDTRIGTNTLVALFVGAIIFDLFQDKTLGLTALVFGVAALLLHTLGKTGLKNPVFWAVGAVGVNIVRSQILWGQIFWVPTIICGVATWAFFRFIWRETFSGKLI